MEILLFTLAQKTVVTEGLNRVWDISISLGILLLLIILAGTFAWRMGNRALAFAGEFLERIYADYKETRSKERQEQRESSEKAQKTLEKIAGQFDSVRDLAIKNEANIQQIRRDVDRLVK